MQEYYNEKVVPFVEAIGYKLRVSNYYVINESDGYINVNYFMVDGKEIIEFYKNYYYGSSRNDYKNYYRSNRHDTDQSFDNFLDFEKFMTNYHKKEIRKIKLDKLNKIE